VSRHSCRSLLTLLARPLSRVGANAAQRHLAARNRPTPATARKFFQIKSRQNIRFYGIIPGVRHRGKANTRIPPSPTLWRTSEDGKGRMEGEHSKDGGWNRTAFLQNEPIPVQASRTWSKRVKPDRVGQTSRKSRNSRIPKSNPVKLSQTQSNPVKPSQTRSRLVKAGQTGPIQCGFLPKRNAKNS